MTRRPNVVRCLADLGENEIVRRLTNHLPLSPQTLIGPGDDCAVLKTTDRRWRQLFKTDCLVEGVHFLPETAPRQIGWKAICRCLSDIAAMGGIPTEVVVTVAAPPEMPWKRLSGIYTGMTTACRKYGVGFVGGETSSAPAGAPLFLSAAMLGKVEADLVVGRHAGRPGDGLFVTGKLGGSLAGWHLKFTPRLDAGRWLAKNVRPSAMMDLSDGLATDLPRLAEASGAGFSVDPATIPIRPGCTLLQALRDGEDFELLFSVPPSRIPKLLAAWPEVFPRLRLTSIGRLTERRDDASGVTGAGWEHFASRRAKQ